MKTASNTSYKRIGAQKLLDAGEGDGARLRRVFTGMILPLGQGGHEQVRELSRGVSGKVAERFRKRAGIDETAFSGIIGYSRMHYSRLAKSGSGLLRAAASNRLYRFAQILEHAIDLYNGDEETALRWLKTPNPAFGDSTPIELLSSEVGSDMVDTLISQLELGIEPA
jgi:putative toxin-antitoxin system antitoxin component (TIGR02293 family)